MAVRLSLTPFSQASEEKKKNQALFALFHFNGVQVDYSVSFAHLVAESVRRATPEPQLTWPGINTVGEPAPRTKRKPHKRTRDRET